MHLRARMKDEEKIKQITSEENKKDNKILKLVNLNEKLNKIIIDIDIRYDDEHDDLSLFSDYLMDVDNEKKHFYFRYEIKYMPVKREALENIASDADKVIELFKELTTKIYYCDEDREIQLSIDKKSTFQNLFNYEPVYAVRRLSDTSDEKKNLLSKHLLKTVSNDPNWNSGIQKVASKINSSLEEEGLSEKIDKITLTALVDTLDSFSNTNGGHTGKLGVNFKLDDLEIEKALLDFIKVYYAQEGNSRINEEKQGLGYSNLIYLLLNIQSFKQKQDPRKVNILFFEEPEAHLHPQMENVFIRYLNKIDEDFQMLITTHSSEIAKTIEIEKIKVLRSTDSLHSILYDMKKFMEVKLKNKQYLKEFYNNFFQFSMIEVIFADKVILFEGDAERLMLKFIISDSDDFDILANQYISFIQVGGAYANRYIELLTFLEIKALFLTDIDYKYSSDDLALDESELIQDIKKRVTTNETIKQVVGESTISNIYELQEDNRNRNILYNDNICLKFQGELEGFARTLEDAILHKKLSVTVK